MRQAGRILMTADAVGGVWRYTVDLGRALRARGFQTTVAVMGPAPDAQQRDEARRAHLVVVDRPYRLEWMDDPFTDVQLAGRWLLGLEQQVAPTVVHLNGYAHAALPWRAPVVVVAHSCVRTWWRAVKGEAAPPRLDRYTAMVRTGLTAAGMIVAPTTAMGRALESEYGRQLRMQVIPNGCDRPPVPARALTGKEALVLSAGRAWDEAKNIQALCSVAGSLEWPVAVAGDARSPSGRSCELTSVRCLGRLSPGELSGWYRRASIYALPARYEPFGLSVLEAALAGCALVLGDIPSLRENWHGAAAFVPPDDRQALASALRHLIDRADERQELARRALARAASFSMARTADAYLQAYQGLVA